MKKREFRPALEGTRLEERVVLSPAVWVGPPFFFPTHTPLGRVLPTTSVMAVSNVGATINQDYRAAAQRQEALSAAATATGSTVTANQYRLQTLNNLTVLNNALSAAAAALPDGSLLASELTAVTTTVGRMIVQLNALPTAKPTFTVADVNTILGGIGFPNFTAAANQANAILWAFVQAGVNGGRFRVLGYVSVIGVGPAAHH